MSKNTDEIQEDSFSSDAELDEEAEESSTDIDAKLEEEDVFDVEFFKCYSALKKKDEKIYDQNVKFFEEQDLSSNTDDSASEMNNSPSSAGTKQKRAITPKMTLLDHQLRHNEEDIEEPNSEKVKIDLNKEVSKSFYEKELEEIKKTIEKVGEELDSDSDSDDLLIVKDKQSIDKDGSNSKAKLKTILDKIEGEEDEDLQHLKNIWSDPKKLTEEDRFLRDYILNKRYLAKSGEDDDADDEDEKDGFFSKNIDDLSDAEDEQKESERKHRALGHRSDEKDFDQISRIPRNSTKTIRDIVEKQEKKEKRLKKLEKVKRKKKSLKDADCEDIVGDLPTKFHYRETEPNDYGLTAEELLLATDEELEKWISLKDCIAYKSPEEEQALKQRFETRRNNIDLKRQIFKSIYDAAADTNDELADQSALSASSTTKKHKKRGRKRKVVSDSESSYKESANDSMPNQSSSSLLEIKASNREGAAAISESNRQKKKKRKKRGLNHKKFAKIGVAPDRLLAYGLSKTKLKKSKIL